MAEPLSVLVVEDEAIVALELEMAVQDAGHEVAGIAGDLKEALEIAADGPVDLALVDINLRDGRTGVEIAHRLKAQHGTLVMFLTANPDLAPRDTDDALGVYPKPYDIAAVVELIAFAAELKRHNRLGQPPRRLQLSDWARAACRPPQF